MRACKLTAFPRHVAPLHGPPTGQNPAGVCCKEPYKSGEQRAFAAEELCQGASHARRAAHRAVVWALEAIVVDGLS